MKFICVVVKPLADGGEGTVEALVEGMNGTYEYVTVTDPMGSHVKARYGILPDQTAVTLHISPAPCYFAGRKDGFTYTITDKLVITIINHDITILKKRQFFHALLLQREKILLSPKCGFRLSDP